jgi:zinc protease
VADYRRDLVEQLYFSMLNARFAEIGQRPDAPFLDAGASVGSYGDRTTDAFTLGADVKDGGVNQGLDALLLEARRANLGFLDSELARAKLDMLRGLEQSYAERAKTVSAAYVGAYVDNFLTGSPIASIDYRYQVAQQLVPTITVADVNALARKWITPTNRVIIVEAPDKPGVAVPTEGDIVAVLDKSAQEPVTAYTETVSADPLVPTLPTPGRVVSERTIAGAGVTEWTLSNGARVLVKPTDFKNDEVIMTSYAMGGVSLAPDSDVVSAQLASDIMDQSGVGAFSATDLAKKLSGKVANVSPTIDETEEGLAGSASPKDLETLFQLMYLQLTSPRLDVSAFGALKNQLVPYVTNRGSDPGSVFEDTIDVTMDEHNIRDQPPTLATLAKIDPAKAFAFYKARFANPGAFTYVFVGNVTLEALKPLVERYLASLPSNGRKETWKDVETGPPTGVIERVVKKGVEPKADTHIIFSGPFVYTPENRLTIRALVALVQIKLDDILREQLGGTYSPEAGSSLSRIPRPQYQIIVDYGSSPQNVDKLSSSFFSIIAALKQMGPAQTDVDKVKEELIRAHEVEVKTNGYWAGNIAARDQAGEDIAGLGDAYTAMIQRVTPDALQQAAKQYFNTANYAKFVLLPEGSPHAPPPSP